MTADVLEVPEVQYLADRHLFILHLRHVWNRVLCLRVIVRILGECLHFFSFALFDHFYFILLLITIVVRLEASFVHLSKLIINRYFISTDSILVCLRPIEESTSWSLTIL